MNKSPRPVEELTFEEAFAELEKVTNELEKNDHTLEIAMSLYERGKDLTRHCTELLEKAELRIQQLSGENQVEFDQDG